MSHLLYIKAALPLCIQVETSGTHILYAFEDMDLSKWKLCPHLVVEMHAVPASLRHPLHARAAQAGEHHTGIVQPATQPCNDK